MKKTIALILFVFSSCILLYSREDSPVVYLNNEWITLDSFALIVSDPKISHKEKMKIFYHCNCKKSPQREKQISTVNRLLSANKKLHDINGLLYSYACLAELHNGRDNNELFNAYIDSADRCAEKATNVLSLARYHYIKGIQAMDVPYGEKEGYMQFEKAVDYYDRANMDARNVSPYIYSIAVYTANRQDSLFAKQLIRKAENILRREYSPFIDFVVCTMKSDLYNMHFEATNREEMLDSAIFYEKQRISIFYLKANDLPDELDYDVLQSYLLLAEYHSLKKDPDWIYINDCIEKAESIGSADDSYFMSRIKYTKAVSLFEQKRYDEAEKEMIGAENCLSQKKEAGGGMYPPETFYFDELTYADLHSMILYSKGDYREALKYNRLKNALKLKLRDKETNELEYLYNTEKEEHKIEQLKLVTANQMKSIRMLIVIALLLAVTIVLLFLWFFTVKKNIKRRSALIKAEKEEAELNLKIKEEQAVKVQLEKYEVLSDFRLKEMELEGKNRAMEQLLKDKEILDKQIASYMQKLDEYERMNNRKHKYVKTGDAQNRLLLEDIKKLIAKKFPDNRDYIASLDRLGEQYISALKEVDDGIISVSYMKYCVCFAIGMEIGEVAECFSIEQSSVHVIRYRLKRKFGLADNVELDVFLNKINSPPSPVEILDVQPET
jgi:hypothetical protein